MNHKWFVMISRPGWGPDPIIEREGKERPEIKLFDTHADAVIAAEALSIQPGRYEIYKWRL